VRNNVRAAFDVPVVGAARPYLAANLVAGNGAVERTGPGE
jgi:hypothetical protein